ncbi:MAG: hypothetical protein ACR2GN_10635 [Bacteroidia bacterium]
MKSINLLFFITLFTSSIAQPTLNSNEMAPFGSSWTMIYTQSYNVIDTSIQGANVTWNFSAMQPTTSSFTINIVILLKHLTHQLFLIQTMLTTNLQQLHTVILI